jgi:hypothetical protein
MRRAALLPILLLLLLAPPARAWGPDGHAIVGEIAQRRLTPQAAEAVAALLGPRASLASFGSWADDERARDRSTAGWHFVDIPLEETRYDAARDCVHDGRAGDCVVAAIERERAVLACPNAPEAARQRALKFLLHFVGDLHQPFHALAEMRGGTRVEVTIATREGVRGRTPYNTTLHAAWDEAMIEKTRWSWGGYVERLETGFLAGADAAALSRGTPVDWAEETHAVAVRLYRGVPANFVLDDAYRLSILPDLDRQLALGGLRLAALLNEAFATPACG